MPLLALLLILIAILLFRQAARQQKETGLPGGRVIYTDTSRWGPVEKALYDPTLGLTGKPDYLVQKGERLIPVEVKSTRIPEAPYDSHIYQLAAYCLLVQHTYGKRPPYGIVYYADRSKLDPASPNPPVNGRSYAIDYTPTLESALLDILTEIQTRDHHTPIDRSHNSPQRCAHCGYRSTCEQRL